MLWLNDVFITWSGDDLSISIHYCTYYTPHFNEVEGGIQVSPCLSIHPSICPFVHLWTESCPLCIYKNTCRIHFIFAHLIMQLQCVVCKDFFIVINLKFWQIF